MELKKKMIIGLVVVFVLLTGIVYSYSTAPVTEESVVFSAESVSPAERTNQPVTPLPSFKPEDKSENKPQPVKTDEYAEIYVYVCGEVINPGVYMLREGNRIVDAIALAGGFSRNANKDFLNQAMLLADGEKIYVPSKKEVDQTFVPLQEAGKEHTNTENARTNQTKVNLNTATKDQLMTLPGIGESKAEKILSYRESEGMFRAIEDIMKIEGIKNGVFDKIKDSILVE